MSESSVVAWAAEGPTPAAGTDQDEFTLSVAAVEQLEHRLGSLRPGSVRVVTDLAPGRFELFPSALATRPAELVVLGPAEANERWEDEGRPSDGGDTLWVIVSPPTHGDRVVAVLRRPPGSTEAVRVPTPTDPTSEWSGFLRRLAEAGGPGAAAWGAAPSVPEGPELDPTPEVELGQLAEGAYVPRARYVENLPSRWRFAAERCTACGRVNFPPRGFCRQCGAIAGLAATELPRRGLRVTAVTTIHPGAQPSEFDWRVERSGAYDVALVEWDVGARVTLQVADLPTGELRPGDRVDTVLRRLYPMEGEWRYGRKAVRVGEPTASTRPPA